MRVVAEFKHTTSSTCNAEKLSIIDTSIATLDSTKSTTVVGE